MPADRAAARSRATALLGDGRAARLARALYLRWLELRHLLPSSAEPSLFEYLRRGIRPGDVVLDVGGFLGAALGLCARPLEGSGTAFTADGHAILDYI